MRLHVSGFSESTPPDYAEARRALGVLIGPGQTFEIRALPVARTAVCRSIDEAIQAIRNFSGAAGIYYMLNPCRSDLAGPASHGDITARRWLLIDVDPVRPADISATDDEKAASARLAATVVEDLSARGWPSPVLVDSGNGFHILYRIDLPNDAQSQGLIQRLLRALADAHDTGEAKVDTSVHNASRIAKVPGTWARKGKDTPDRPHRMARLSMVPERLDVVGLDLIEAIAGPGRIAVHAPVLSTSPDGSLVVRATSLSGLAAYCRAALQGECARVALAPDGNRNNQLNISAFKLGSLLLCGVLGRSDVEMALTHAARRAGLNERETAATIASGLDAGAREPRPMDGIRDGRGLHGRSPQEMQELRELQKSDKRMDFCNSRNSCISCGDPEVAAWPDPILDGPTPAEPFPLDVLPGPVAEFVGSAAKCLNCPVDYLATACLGVAAGAIGRSYAIRIKDGWVESAAIYLAAVGHPGIAKSPALSMAARPLWAISKELHAARRGDEPVIRIVVDDATVESLAPILRDNPRGLVMVRDELTALFAGLNQYKGGKGADRQFYLKTWSNAAVAVDRKSNPDGMPILIPHPCLTVVGGVTPGMLSELGESKGRDDGFLDRILFSVPDPVPIRWHVEGMPQATEDEWSSVVRRLWDAPMDRDVRTGQERPTIMRFSAEALADYGRWFDELSIETEGEDFPPHLRGPWAKLRAYCARLALILDRMERACYPAVADDGMHVSAVSLSGAIALVGYFKAHICRSRAIIRGVRGDNPDARAVLHWVRKTGREEFSESDARHNFRSRFPVYGPELGEALRWLVERHCIRPKAVPERIGPGRPPSPIYAVNPGLLASEIRAAENPT